MSISCAMPARRFGLIGAAFTAIGFVQSSFLPAGLALLATAAMHGRRTGQRR